MPYTIVQNGTLIDGTGAAPMPNTAVSIVDNKIHHIGTAGAVTLPMGKAEVINAKGGYILPGLIDTHVHIMMEIDDFQKTMAMPFSMNFYKAIHHMRRTLDAGITSVRDAGGADLGVKQSVDQGLIEGPRMQISITVLSITGGHGDGWLPSGMVRDIFASYPGNPDGICDGVEGVRKKVREVLRAGAEIIKICSTGGVFSPTDHPEFTQFSPEELAVIVAEGKARRGVKVMAHAQGSEGIKNAVRAGIHSIEHGIYLDDEAIDLMLEHGTYVVPTLLAPVAVLEMAQSKNLPEYAVRKAQEVIEIHRDSIAKAHERGVRIAMGTDAGVMPHGTNLRELGLMVDIGMSPMEAIVATTKTAAECLGWQDRVGTLEVNKLADVIVTKTNPLEDIRSLENPDNIVLVMKDGKVAKNLLQ